MSRSLLRLGLSMIFALAVAACSSGGGARPDGGGGTGGATATGGSGGSGGTTSASGGTGGDTTAMGGSGGTGGATAPTGGSGGTTSASGGTGGETSASGGSGGGGWGGALSTGGAGGGDTPAPRALMTDGKGFREKTFTAASLDPTATQGHATSTEYAAVDPSKPLMKELCVVLTDMGQPPGIAVADWMYPHGFHVLQIAYQNDVAIAPAGDTNPSTPGDTRMDQFDGKGRVSWVTIKRADSLEERVVRALKHMMTADPGGDWGWYLGADGNSVRWSDGCIVGYGYGGTMAAVIAHNVRLARAVSIAAPDAQGRPDAKWLSPTSATPAARMFAIFGANDTPAGAGRYEPTTAALGYLGDVVHVGLTAKPDANNPYGGSHRLELDGMGKGSTCNAGADYPPCLYSFGLPIN
ncbi:MAG TPA: hypothetical protein VHJ20_15160 [Polyangia bacterium]|nr:hypothetical protein [Polyangia bacterium]